jgi:hypothetical protein
LARPPRSAGTLWLNRLSAAISDAGGVTRFDLVALSADVVSAAGHIPTFTPASFI